MKPARTELSPEQELRLSRTLLLDELQEDAAASLIGARVLVIGAGGLGCPAAQALAAAGVGSLIWVDGDTVEGSNLGRQTLFGPGDVGRLKVIAGQTALRRLNPDCSIEAISQHADDQNLPPLLQRCDLVLDCTDRFATRQLINRLCHMAGRPLVIGSVIRWSGQLLVVRPEGEGGCYACVFDPAIAASSESRVDAACGAYGVFPTASAIMGLTQAHQALKILLGLPSGEGELLLWDAKSLRWDRIALPRRPGCPVCGQGTAND